jgi:Family of unknown function (DUF6404)
MAPVEAERDILFRAKLEAALRLMKARRMRRWSYAPGIYRLLWVARIPIRPPHFVGLISNTMIQAFFFCLIWIALWCWTTWLGQRVPVALLLIGTLAAPIFGFLVAIYYRFSAARHRLPSWSELRAEADIFD